ncbi:CpsD/CapB family tyrosine-protein kinase [Primorskyibacter sp. 2E233]|uniref:CpsD/CapB family tyrosine-protein kinase n=1 Tax=Primorskyibacter sp. 2E233 TaxID=3413431 RepID=UPI003BF42CA5
MEKLQIAIEHARKRRDSGAIDIVNSDELSAEQGPKPQQPSDRWALLEPFEIKPRLLARNRIACVGDSGSAKNTIDMLRTRLLTMMREKGWTRVMITSPSSGCGKSTLTANLALALQRQEDLKTLVFDLDLQQAELGRKLGLIPQGGIDEFLLGEVSALAQFRRIGDNLAISAGRKKTPGSTELLKTKGAQRRIDEAEAEFSPDVVLFDVPPIFACDDTIVAAGFVDCAIIVCAAEQNTIAELEEVERDLAQYTNIAGVVLNKCRSLPKQSGYGYNYR